MKLLTFLFIFALIGLMVTLTIFWTAMILEEPAVKHQFTKLQPEHYFDDSISPISKNTINKELIIRYDEELFLEQASNTGSMRPAIGDYANLIVTKNLSNLQVGDIVTYHCNGSLNMRHRIVKIENGTYTMKGDANSVDDYVGFNCTATIKNITGKVVGILY